MTFYENVISALLYTIFFPNGEALFQPSLPVVRTVTQNMTGGQSFIDKMKGKDYRGECGT